MTVAIKYCGGCNPRFDRGALVKKLKNDFPRLRVTDVGIAGLHSGEHSSPLLSAVICGCPSRCAEHSGLPDPKIIVGGPEDFPALYAAVERLNP